MRLSTNKVISCIGLRTNSPTSLLDSIRRRVGVGELDRRRVDWIPGCIPFQAIVKQGVESL